MRQYTPAIRIVALLFLASGLALPAAAQAGGSLADLARKERARKAAVAQRARVIANLDSTIDCGANWTCMMQAVDDRIPAHMRFPDEIDLTATQGWTIHSDVRLDVQNCTEETCTLLGRTENTKLTFAENHRQEFLKNGWTAEQLEKAERFEELKVKKQDDARVTCTFRRGKLKEFLAGHRDGSADYKGWELADHCDGLDQTITNPSAPPPTPMSR